MLWPSSVFSKKRPNPPHLAAGFSLVEMMISITIMVIVISVVSISQGTFNGAVLLRGEAYDMALTIREVQLEAVGAVGSQGDFRAVYGVHFDTSGQYIIFKDANANGFWESGEEYGLQPSLDRRFEIRAIRPGGSGEEVSIVFVRPNFDARFFHPTGEVIAPRVEIDIARRGSTETETGPGDVRTLEVSATGQISVKNN